MYKRQVSETVNGIAFLVGCIYVEELINNYCRNRVSESCSLFYPFFQGLRTMEVCAYRRRIRNSSLLLKHFLFRCLSKKVTGLEPRDQGWWNSPREVVQSVQGSRTDLATRFVGSSQTEHRCPLHDVFDWIDQRPSRHPCGSSNWLWVCCGPTSLAQWRVGWPCCTDTTPNFSQQRPQRSDRLSTERLIHKNCVVILSVLRR